MRTTTPEQYEIHLAKLIDQRVAERRAALVARDEKTMRQVADEMLEHCLESRQFLELLSVAPLESQAVVGKRFANLLEQSLVTEAHDWAVREAAAGERRRKESRDESRIDRAQDALAA